VLKYSCGDRIPIIYVYSTITGLRHLESGSIYNADEFIGWNAWAMCGIGNPRAFVDDVVGIGVGVVGESLFRDHYEYKQVDVDRVTSQARTAGADLIVTTEKDAVRLNGLKLPDVPVYAAQLEVRTEDEVRLKSLLLRLLAVRR
jgi:tetraacyldisaccharide 4'-kinase